MIRFILFMLFSLPAFSADYYFKVTSPSGDPCIGLTGSSASTVASACVGALQAHANANGSTSSYSFGTLTRSSDTLYNFRPNICSSSGSCALGGNRGISRFGTACPAGSTWNSAAGSCDAPSNPCTSKLGQATNWKKTYTSFDAYTSSPMGEKANQDGCTVDVGTLECGTNAAGEFACWGSGTYTGEQSTDGPVEGCLSDCDIPEPTKEETAQNCSAPTTTGSTTSYTCVTSSQAEQFASSNCSFGDYNGTTGYHCTSPDYVPASDSQTRTDSVSETTNPDGSKTTTTTSTTEKTYCEGGSCKTSTTTTTTTKGTDANGNPTGESTACTGDDCKAPEDPKDGKMPGTVPGPSTDNAYPEIGDGNTPTYFDSTFDFYGRVGASPLVVAIGSITVPRGGSCNIGDASLFGGTVSFDEFCDMAPEVLGGLRYIFLAIWAWAAIRLFMTA